MPNDSTNALGSSDHPYISEHSMRRGRSTLPISHKGKQQHRFTHSSPAGSHLITQPRYTSYQAILIPKGAKASEWAHPVAHPHLFLPASHRTSWWGTGLWCRDTETLRREAKGGFSKTIKCLGSSHAHSQLIRCVPHLINKSRQSLTPTQELVGKALLKHTSAPTLLAGGKARSRKPVSLAEQFPQTALSCFFIGAMVFAWVVRTVRKWARKENPTLQITAWPCLGIIPDT